MTDTYHLLRPASLVPGGRYRRLQRDGASGQAVLVAVEFLAHTACPAFVVVVQGRRRLRCPRDDLFEAADSDDQGGSFVRICQGANEQKRNIICKT
jgi:hypothetical protein